MVSLWCWKCPAGAACLFRIALIPPEKARRAQVWIQKAVAMGFIIVPFNSWLVVTGFFHILDILVGGWWLLWLKGYKPTTMGIWWWSGWWWLEHGFGTWLDYEFPIILVMSSSQLTFICFRGIEITNQVNLWWISNGLSLLTIGFLGNISLDEVKNLFKNWGAFF